MCGKRVIQILSISIVLDTVSIDVKEELERQLNFHAASRAIPYKIIYEAYFKDQRLRKNMGSPYIFFTGSDIKAP